MTTHSNALDRNTTLTQLIRQTIEEQGGAISFATFMALALYAPNLGYYTAANIKLGKHGDFMTAPEISPFFARCLANQCQQIFTDLPKSDFLEIGGGSGIFAADLLLALEKLHALPNRYLMFEISPDLRTRQKQCIEKHCPHLASRVVWLDQLPTAMTGIIFANEVLDALPVHCFQITAEGAKECCVSWHDDQFVWSLNTPSADLANAIIKLETEQPLPIGYRSEIHLTITPWIQSLANCLQQGVILCIDYGYGRAEYYHPDRSMGTLKCFSEHRHSDDPLHLVGLQDITAHVDFTQVTESALAAGLSLKGYTTQAAFLMNCGLLEMAESLLSKQEYEKTQQIQAIKQLLLPSEMGELVKVIGFSKSVATALNGFLMHDKRRNL